MNDMSHIVNRSERSRALETIKRHPVLMIVHQEHSNPGRVGTWFRSQGFALDIRRPRFGDPLPETMASHSAAVVFGGPMSANDPDDYVKRETDWMGVPLAEEAPLLGICLGAQMLSQHLGGTVRRHADELVEIGYHPIQATAEGQVVVDWPDTVYQWHNEGFSIPSGAMRLASGPVFENQAFSYGPRALGIQFHPEMNFQMVNKWTNKNPDRLLLNGAHPRPAQLADHHIHARAVQNWLDDVLTRLLTVGLMQETALDLSTA